MEKALSGASFVNEETTIKKFVGFSKSWTFMKPTSRFSLPTSVNVKHLRETIYKGMQSVSGFNGMYRVKMGRYCGKDVSLIILTPDRDLDENTIKDEFIEAVNETLSELAERATGRALQARGFTTYASALDGCAKARELNNSTEHMSVDLEIIDIIDFGASFNQHFEERLQRHISDCQTFSVVKGFVHIRDWKLGSWWLSFFDICEFAEIAILLRKDFICKDGCVLWNRQALVELIGVGPCEEYYPGLFDQTGNFTFNLLTDNISDGYSSKEKVENAPQVTVLEFTTELFEELRSRKEPKNALFYEPVFSLFLSGRKINDEYEGLKEKCEINLVRFKDSFDHAVVEKEAGSVGLAGRCGALVTCMTPEEESPRQMLLKFHEMSLAAENRRTTCVLPMSVARFHLKDTLLPVYYTLLELFNTKVDGSTKKKDYMPSIDTLKLASVCEAIICFGIHGTWVSTSEWSMQSRKLANAVGLTDANFRMQKEEKGLYRLKNVRVSGNRRILIDIANIENLGGFF